jgi:uncharacterized protein HemX
VAPPTKAAKPALAAVGGATALTRAEPPRSGEVSSATLVAAPEAGSPPAESSSTGGPPVLVLVLIALVLAYVCARLGFHLWRRRRKRLLAEDFRRQDEEWEAALRQIELSQTIAASNGNGESMQSVKVWADF